jgi:penicillin-insensitive murein endopeptidase
MKRLPIGALTLIILLLGIATAFAKGNPWQSIKTPFPGPPRAIGDYSAGCIQGAQALPMTGDGYQVMHPSRLRYYGHPDLIGFIETLGHRVREAGLKVILLGDLSQPRGGRALGGHASHQSGLDVDVWFWYPKQAGSRPLTTLEREQFKAKTILDSKTSGVQAKWVNYASKVLKFAAEDKRVERIFVHPIIKRELCAQPGKDREWLGKIRPWHGHDDHLHARLHCPDDSPDCVPQPRLPKGDGCAELPWWFSPESRTDREQALGRYHSKVVTERQLPTQCYEMLK